MNPFNPPGEGERSEDELARELGRNMARGPSAHATAFVHSRSVVVGNVVLQARSSVWPCAVLRGDIAPIEVGEGSNVQDGVVVHVADGMPAVIGAWVTVGHLAVLHACKVEDECLIGMHATVLDGAVIGRRSIVGAGALVTKGTVVPPGSLVLGSPAKVVRPLSAEEQDSLRGWAEKYVKVASYHRRFD